MNKRDYELNRNIWIDIFKIDSSRKNILLNVEVTSTYPTKPKLN